MVNQTQVFVYMYVTNRYNKAIIKPENNVFIDDIKN